MNVMPTTAGGMSAKAFCSQQKMTKTTGTSALASSICSGTRWRLLVSKSTNDTAKYATSPSKNMRQ